MVMVLRAYSDHPFATNAGTMEHKDAGVSRSSKEPRTLRTVAESSNPGNGGCRTRK